VLQGVVGAQYVETTEHPATARRLLVGNRLLGRLDIKIGVEGSSILAILSQVVDGIGSNGVGQRPVDGHLTVLLLDVAQHVATESATRRLCHSSTHGAKGAKCEKQSSNLHHTFYFLVVFFVVVFLAVVFLVVVVVFVTGGV